MSFDPFGVTPGTPSQPTPPGTPAAPPPAGPPPVALGREHVLWPAIFLIALGVLNLVVGLGAAGFGASTRSLTPEQLDKLMEQQNPKQYDDFKKAGYSGKDLLNIYFYGGVCGGAFIVLTSLLTILGGVLMLSLRGYWLAMLASILTAIPCLSPASCCLVGFFVGIWAVVVLLRPEVRSAFR